MLKLGLIGVSEGNGHPYSWSAIFNGYDALAMESCGYPVIPRYLEQQPWPDSRIREAEVTHIWTQDQTISRHVAQATKIATINQRPEDMIGAIDALLLARDDAEHHYLHAKPFLEAGLPVYIDKPIALSVDALESLYALQLYPGQIFTCSALRYSDECLLHDDDRKEIGQIRQVIAITPKSWEKYAVHIVEPVIGFLDPEDKPLHFYPLSNNYPLLNNSLLLNNKDHESRPYR